MGEILDTLLDWVAANPGWMGLVIFLTAMGESLAIVGIVVPGAAMMFGFGALIALGHVELWTALLWSVAGAVAGDGLSFWLGRSLHERMRALWPFSRHPRLLERGEAYFHRHGGKSVLFGRFFGPVRAVVPAVAGMLDMHAGRFLAVNVGSAILWAPAYLLPGIVFGASLELAAQVAWRLVLLIVLVVGLLWLTAWLIHRIYDLTAPRLENALRAFYRWSAGRPVLGPIGAALFDPRVGELRGLATLAVILAAGTAFVVLALGGGPGELSAGLHRFVQGLRTPWADRAMTLVTELGDAAVYLPACAAVIAWLAVRRAWPPALHLLAALGAGTVLVNLLKWTLQVPRPPGASLDTFSFPSAHAVMSTVAYGFLAVLVARETRPERRWLPYLGAALLYVPIAFSRVYLGVHWAGDVVAGVCLGLAWVTALGIAYGHHRPPRLPRRGLLLACVLPWLAAATINAILHFEADLDRYRAEKVVRTTDLEHWWNGGWASLPARRIDLGGEDQEALTIQWAARLQEIQHRLAGAGWRPAPRPGFEGLLRLLSPDAELSELPVLPRAHDGRHEALAMVRPAEGGERRLVVRFWRSGLAVGTAALPVWSGAIETQQAQRRLGVWIVAAEETARAREALGTAIDGLSVDHARREGGEEILRMHDRTEVENPDPPSMLKGSTETATEKVQR